MKKTLPLFLIIPSMIVSGCSAPVEKQSADATEEIVAEYEVANNKEFTPVEVDSEPQSDGAPRAGLVNSVPKELARGYLSEFLNTITSQPYASIKALEATGLSADEIINGAGDEATRTVLLQAIPEKLIDASNASLQDELAAYAYILKISSLFEVEGVPPYLTVKEEALEFSPDMRSAFLPADGEGISMDYVASQYAYGLAYILSTPFTINEISSGSSEVQNWWGVNAIELAKAAREIGDLEFTGLKNDLAD